MRLSTLATVCFVVAVPWPAVAQDQPVMPQTLSAGLLARFDEAITKMTQLAEAIPADKYSWRPSPEVRSVSQVIVHVAMGNYYTGEDVGLKPPSDLPRDAERAVVDKMAVLALLKRASAHLRTGLQGMTDESLGRTTNMFGQQTTYANAYLFGVGHVHEHLGQLIAYARMLHVPPPWSAAH